MGRASASQIPTLVPNFTIVLLKCGLIAPKIGNFWYKFPPKGHTPLSDFFYKIWLGGVSPRSAPSCQISVLALKCGLTAPKIVKYRNFWYKCAHKRKFWECTEKVEYRCATTNLRLCNDTIIVLKITLLHCVSVITNFVIPKRDKQTKKTNEKNITLFCLYSRRVTHDLHHTWHGDRGQYHFCSPLAF